MYDQLQKFIDTNCLINFFCMMKYIIFKYAYKIKLILLLIHINFLKKCKIINICNCIMSILIFFKKYKYIIIKNITFFIT